MEEKLIIELEHDASSPNFFRIIDAMKSKQTITKRF